MGFSISGGGGDWLGILLVLLGLPAAIIVLWVLLVASKQAHDDVVEHDPDGNGPVA